MSNLLERSLSSEGHGTLAPNLCEQVPIERGAMDAMRSAGMTPPQYLLIDSFVRFPGVDKPSGNTSGWAFLSCDRERVHFGCWSTGFKDTWFSSRCKNPVKDARYFEELRKIMERNAAERARLQSSAAQRARSIWAQSKPASEQHRYLMRKGVRSHIARQVEQSLVLPVVNWNRELVSLQYIWGDGKKRLLKNGRKKGCFIPIRWREAPPSTIFIAEGFATAASVAEMEEQGTVFAAIDAYNLVDVAVGARAIYPHAEIVIAGDLGDVGERAARDAAIQASARVAFPPDTGINYGNDWNDYFLSLRGAA